MAFGKTGAELETLRELLADLLGARLGHRLFEFASDIGQIELGEDVADGLSTHADAEGVCTVLLFGFTQIDFGEELTALKRCAARIDDHVVFVVDHAFQRTSGHVEHEADSGRHALVEPDVRHRHSEFDVAHALTTNAGKGHFNTAAVANDALMLDALILAAGAFPVTGRSEDTLTEQAAFFGLERAVVDGFRVFDFAGGPGTGAVSRGDADRHIVELLAGLGFPEDFFQARVSIHDVWRWVAVFSAGFLGETG